VKIGMIGSAKIARAILTGLAGVRAPIVLDPILRSTSGAPLVDDAAALDALIARATIVTPNREEAAALGGVEGLARRGARAILLKDRLDSTAAVVDRLIDADGELELSGPRLFSPEVHGTGCALASAICAGLALGKDLRASCREAHAFVRGKIVTARTLG